MERCPMPWQSDAPHPFLDSSVKGSGQALVRHGAESHVIPPPLCPKFQDRALRHDEELVGVRVDVILGDHDDA